MKVLVTGSSGQLGTALLRSVPDGIEVLTADRATLDLSKSDCVEAAVIELAPELIINAAAYTAVDKAESEQTLASQINSEAPAAIANAARQLGSRMIQISTDFVFSGATVGPWPTDARPNPINHYGASKLAGETAVTRILADRASIVRTAWVYAPWGQNFVHSMLRLMSEREQLGIVADQIGTPTSATGLAGFLWQLACSEKAGGTWHWTDAGVASWYDFAVSIQELALEKGLVDQPCEITPIESSQFPTPAKRPGFSVLDKTTTWRHFDCNAPHWRIALVDTLDAVKMNGKLNSSR